MDHIQQENQYRIDVSQLTDDKLIRLDKTYQLEHIQTDEKLLADPNPNLHIINLSEFQKRFYQATGGGCSYLDWNHIVVAGGSVSNALNGSLKTKKSIETDCDLFIYGCDEDTARKVIDTTITNIIQYYDDLPGGKNDQLKHHRTKLYFEKLKQTKKPKTKTEFDDSDKSESNTDPDNKSENENNT